MSTIEQLRAAEKRIETIRDALRVCTPGQTLARCRIDDSRRLVVSEAYIDTPVGRTAAQIIDLTREIGASATTNFCDLLYLSRLAYFCRPESFVASHSKGLPHSYGE